MDNMHGFTRDVMRCSARRNMAWYKNNLLGVLTDLKDRHARDIDKTIEIARELVKVLEEKVEEPVVVPPRNVIQSEDDSLMKPVAPEVTDILYKSTEKGGDEKYLKERNKLSPEEKFFFRIVSSWDYGWQQKSSRVPARSVNYGRHAILRDTFYRKNNAGPDPPHYAQPSGGQISICSEYSCNAN